MLETITMAMLPSLRLLDDERLLAAVAGALVSVPVAALLIGSSEARVRRLSDSGVLKNRGGCHRRIAVADLSALHGKPLGARAWRAAINRCNGGTGTAVFHEDHRGAYAVS